jgi:hypothetical protein
MNNITLASGVQLSPEILEMIDIWKREFPTSWVKITQELVNILTTTFEEKFNSSLQNWEKHLQLIKSSPRLMNPENKIWIKWAVNHKIISILRSGGFEVSLAVLQENFSPTITNKPKYEFLVEEHLKLLNEPHSCINARKVIAEKEGHKWYLANMMDVELFIVEEDEKKPLFAISTPLEYKFTVIRDKLQLHTFQDVSTTNYYYRFKINLETPACQTMREMIQVQMEPNTYQSYANLFFLIEKEREKEIELISFAPALSNPTNPVRITFNKIKFGNTYKESSESVNPTDYTFSDDIPF